MPARFPAAPAACALVVALCCGMLPAAAQSLPAATLPKAAGPINNSGLDAALFYQLLIGELKASANDPGSAYSVLLDAARKSKNEQIFRRAIEIALQARSGDLALKAAQVWKAALPDSLEATRYVVQLLVALNRSAQAAEPLRSMIALTPAQQRSALITSLPRFFERAGDRQLTPALLEKALEPYVDQPETRVASLVAIGRAAQGGGNIVKALDLAQRSHAFEPSAPAPVLLALDLLPGAADAEPIVLGHLQVRPQADAIRLFYARVLAVSQRHAEALIQIEQVTRHTPELAAPWLTLGALHMELHQPRQATAALDTYLRLVRARLATPAATPAIEPAHSTAGAADIEDDEAALGPDRGTGQALLMLAQAAEQMGDFKAADNWLNQIESPQRALEVQLRRASLLTRQGRLAEALALVRNAPEASEGDARSKVLAEVQLLREHKLWQQADQALDKANLRFVNDPDLIYEQAMTAEKLDRIDDMERLLRRVIALRPEYYHAHNALGYSLADRGLRLPEAKALIERALELAPGEPFITDSLGWVEYRMGDRAAAIKHLTRAYRARPDAEIAAHLGEVLWMDGQRDEARRVLTEGKARDAGSEALRETLTRLKVDL